MEYGDIIYWILIALIGLIYTLVRTSAVPVQTATLLIGKVLAPPEAPGLSRSNGAQDALTYDHQKLRQIISILCAIAILAIGYQLRWFIGFVVIAAVFIVSSALISITRKPLIFYVGRMIAGLQRRRADLVRKNESQRAEACEWFETELTKIYEHLFSSKRNLPLPAHSVVKASTNDELRRFIYG